MTHAALPADDAFAERPMWPALRRGWSRRCPNCGFGPLLRGYLKVRESCPVCGEAPSITSYIDYEGFCSV